VEVRTVARAAARWRRARATRTAVVMYGGADNGRGVGKDACGGTRTGVSECGGVHYRKEWKSAISTWTMKW
jgi:hypothetical protein